MLLSGFLSAFLVEHMVISPAADRLLLPADDAEEEGNEKEEQTAGDRQTDDHF